ncbi:MGMT family protein [Salinibacterium sp. ZJ450]|uniref:MGMT family protein n=1 Tax=Salinibacterium sp. ZJ450 TaxID=2708338 RepID=UPI001421158D|nr:MGMT family protein [Salinibacterium sp. ZJ450]
MTESTGFTIRVIEITVSIPAGRALNISKVAELVESDRKAVSAVLREYKDSGVPWWRIIDDEGTPIFGNEFGARALEQYLTEGTPLRPSPSDLGYAIALDTAAPDDAAVVELEQALADPAADVPAEAVSAFDVTAQPGQQVQPAQPRPADGNENRSGNRAAGSSPFDELLRGNDAGNDTEATPHRQG